MNDFTSAALQITGIGLAGIFIFMIIFFFTIKLIDKIFPARKTNRD